MSRTNPPDDALFVMGSVGTVAQSDRSDLDVWVCHRGDLSAAGREQLRLKCERLTAWAMENTRLDIHFFLMEPGYFRSGQLGQLSEEGSGSAQRYLLLDEFYRTAVWLAGRLPLWWLVPAGCETRYSEYAHTLLSRRFINPDTVIDFGGLPGIPEEEFVGAGIWQLYKGIDSPYKSVLKLMLMEAYCRGRARRPLALDFKSAVYASTPRPDALDPYVMVYRALETYLTAIDASDRLDLARRCLYFKCDKPLTRTARSGEADSQRRILEQLVSEWGWDRETLRQLDERRRWKAPQVMQERQQLVAELSTSYRLIHSLGQGKAEAHIRNDELTLLGRKLHAAFERKAGKVERLNPGISRDMAESEVQFVKESEGEASALTEPVWALYRARQGRIEPPAFKRSRHLLELLVWSQSNGVLTQATAFEVRNGPLQWSAPQCQQLVYRLQQWLPTSAVPHKAFQQPARVERMLWLIDMDAGMAAPGGVRSSADYQAGAQALTIHSLDIVQCNSWGEVICRRLEGDLLQEGLQYLLRALPPGDRSPAAEVSFVSFARQGNVLTQYLDQLWRDLQIGFCAEPRSSQRRYLVEASQGYLLIHWVQQQPSVTRCDDYASLLERLGQRQPGYSPLVVDRHALKNRPLRLMAQAAREPGVYVFYRVFAAQAEVSLWDERGSLLTVMMPFYSHATLLRPLAHFLRAAQARLAAEEGGFAVRDTGIRFFEVLGRVEQGQGYLEERTGGGELDGLNVTDVQVIAEAEASGELRYTVFCNGQEFSELDYPSNRLDSEALFVAVVQDILASRPSGVRYPCYITDLDISQCRDWLAPQTGLQLSDYLRLKAQLEQRLNSALHKA